MQYLAVAFLTLLLLAPAAPAAAQTQPEVYASGMRNPYRWSFDRQTGDLLVGDVGGSQREEIDFIAGGRRAAARTSAGTAASGNGARIRLRRCPVQLLRAAHSTTRAARTW